MQKKIHMILVIATSGFFLLLDQVLKWIARHSPDMTLPFGTRSLGWEYFENRGIALSLPFPNWLILAVTPIILTFLVILLTKKRKASRWFTVGLVFIIAGAVSNYIDRLFFGVTIDYFRLLTSVINLADVMIVGGAVLLLLDNRQRTRQNPSL